MRKSDDNSIGALGDRTRRGVLVLLVLCATLGGVLRAQAPDRSTEPLYVTVENKGQLVQGLTEENFRVFIDGKESPFELTTSDEPRSVGLLVEYSQQSFPYLSDIQKAVDAFVDAAPEGNWYALATYSHDLDVDVDFTKQKEQIRTAFASLGQPLWDDIDTYDAVYRMLDTMGRLPRPVLIFIGSGLETYSHHSLKDVEERLDANNVVVYGIGAGSLLRTDYEPYLSDSDRMSLFQAQAFIRTLAEKSGGQAWFPNFDAAYRDVLRGAVQDWTNQYELDVPLDSVGSGTTQRQVKVEASGIVNGQMQQFKVRVRSRIP